MTGDITHPIVLVPRLLAMTTAENPFLTQPIGNSVPNVLHYHQLQVSSVGPGVA